MTEQTNDATVPCGRYEDPDIWETHLEFSMGFVANSDEDARGVLALWPDEVAIDRAYGDCIPREIVVVRRSAKPMPQHPGATDFYRAPSSWISDDKITLVEHMDDVYGHERAVQLWEAAIGVAERLNRLARECAGE